MVAEMTAALRAAERPTIALAISGRKLRSALSLCLEQKPVRVTVVEASLAPIQELLRDVQERSADVLVVDRGLLSGADARGLAARNEPADPAVVIVTAAEDAADRVRWTAAGVATVLDAGHPAEELGEAIEAVAAAARSDTGAIGAPDVRGTACEPRMADFLSRSPAMLRILEVVKRVAASDTTLLIAGETGVGKERLARAIHSESPRAQGPFVSVNLGGLSESLVESELFGHEEGAFTGASRRRPGQFELADGGTILLDEVGEMPRHLQVKLLTVLQRHEIRRVGGGQPVPLDVRVMAATHRDLLGDVRRGRFREDLYYRLNVVPLHLPPLRERSEDVPDLVGRNLRHFCKLFHRRDVLGITDAALRALLRYRWPGNLRELVNVVERATLLCAGPLIGLRDLPEGIVAESCAPSSRDLEDLLERGGDVVPPGWLEMPLAELRHQVLERLEKSYLTAQLRASRGRLNHTARRSGLAARSLYEKMRRHDLRKEDFR